MIVSPCSPYIPFREYTSKSSSSPGGAPCTLCACILYVDLGTSRTVHIHASNHTCHGSAHPRAISFWKNAHDAEFGLPTLSLSFFLSSPALYAPDGVFCLTKTSRTPSWPKTLPSADADRHQKPRQPRLPRSKRRPKFFDGPPQRRFLVSFSFKGGRACEYQDSVIISSIREKSGFSDLRSSTSPSMAPTAAPLDPTRTRPGKCAAEFLEPPCEMFKMIRQLGVVAFGWFGG